MEIRTEPQVAPPRLPGAVIFAAILNFFSAAVSLLMLVCALTVLVLIQLSGPRAVIEQEIQAIPEAANLAIGLSVLTGVVLAVSLSFAVFFLALGVGLIRRNKAAWYAQVVLSVLGLLGFPFGTALSVVLLVLFFRPATRDHFGV